MASLSLIAALEKPKKYLFLPTPLQFYLFSATKKRKGKKHCLFNFFSWIWIIHTDLKGALAPFKNVSSKELSV